MTNPEIRDSPTRTWGERFLGLAGRRLILASASPRRSELLKGLGIPHQVRPVSVDEAFLSGEEVDTAVVRLAAKKAAAAFHPDQHDALVIGADTVVVLGDRVFGKPRSPSEAREMLGELSGQEHRVVTGIAVLPSSGTVVTGLENTQVLFRVLTSEDIDILVDSGEAMDKAGGYGIQGLGSMVVRSISGDYFNVVGLPLGRLQQVIKKVVRG